MAKSLPGLKFYNRVLKVHTDHSLLGPVNLHHVLVSLVMWSYCWVQLPSGPSRLKVSSLMTPWVCLYKTVCQTADVTCCLRVFQCYWSQWTLWWFPLAIPEILWSPSVRGVVPDSKGQRVWSVLRAFKEYYTTHDEFSNFFHTVALLDGFQSIWK